MAKFLPPEARGVTYAIQNNAQSTFKSEAPSFMKELAQKMAVEAVNDTGRIPSLMSRAYNFYIDLFPDQFAGGGADQRTGRAEAQKRARRAFRGIVALLALRDGLGLEIKLKKFPDDGPGVAAGNAYRPVFMESYGEAPEFGKSANVDQDERGAGPGPTAAASTGPWRQLRYLVVRTPIRKTPDGKDESGQDRFKVEFKEEPLCGLSPFTLFFPAGTPLKHCNNIFWYKQTFDEQNRQTAGEWLDPTTDWTGYHDGNSPVAGVSYEIIKAIRGYMAKWLDSVLQGPPQAIWKAFGLRGRANKIYDELDAWLAELRGLECAPEPEQLRVEDAPLQLNVSLQGQAVGVPLLEQKAAWGAEGRPCELPGLVSELPRAGDRVLLSDEILRNAGLRICGGLMGNELLSASLKSLPPEGKGFVVYHGEKSYYIPEPYVIVDRLFLDNLHLVADGPLSDRFFAIKTEGSNDELWWLLPFRPELLPYLDLDALRRRNSDVVKCVRSGGPGENFLEVTVTVGGVTFRHQYPWKSANRDMTGNALDVRIWPNFRFNTAPKLPAVDADRVHYFRIRQHEVWNLRTQILARRARDSAFANGAAVQSFQPKLWDIGWPEELDPHAFRSSRCYAFPAKGSLRAVDGRSLEGEWEPVGLVFENRGICLFSLEEPAAVPHGRSSPWRIAVDFGTSNTCVAAAVDAHGVALDPKEVRFELQTMSLHLYPKYERVDELLLRGQYTEGAAAVLDFPYKYADETHITEAAYFPTQWLTRLPEGAQPINTEFLMSNGLIFARNLLDFKDIVQLLYDYPPAPVPDRRPFRVVPDAKWKHRINRPAFLRHLYRMIVYHAARRGAQITSAAFSFPRAFSKSVVDQYRNELNTIFQDEGQIPATGMSLMTESDAVQHLMAAVESSESPLVLDVGGGTTDLLGLFQQRRFQASYEFAAGLVNLYFTKSPPLQRMFEDALWKVIKEEEKGTRKGDQQGDRKKLLKDLFAGQGDQHQIRADYMEQGFFRMLGMLEDRNYPALVDELQKLGEGAQNEANRKALAGFFYTLVLLYTGMVYQAGRLMRLHDIRVANVKVRMIGNGSRFYRFLSHRSSEFDKVLQGMLYAGYQQKPEFKLTLEPEGKTLVAKGLLAPPSGNRAEVTPDPESHAYLLALAERADAAPPTPKELEALMQQDLVPFLEALNRELPSGQLDASTVIPFCEPSLVDEMRRLFVPITTGVFSREVQKAKELKEDWAKAEQLAKASERAATPHRESALATEPVFVIRLKCLIEKIRDLYANCQ